MKLLFDQNLSPSLAENFKENFDVSVHVPDLKLDRAEDSIVWEYAKINSYTIVSKDSDFNNMVSLFGFPPKVMMDKKGELCHKRNQSIVNKKSGRNQEIHRRF